MQIVTTGTKRDERFLRQKTRAVDLTSFPLSERRQLITDMKTAMRDADGVGLSANQVGLTHRLFIAEVADARSKRKKFYTMLNPKVIKLSPEKEEMDEGCLSVPGVFGPVSRSNRITITGVDLTGKPVKIKAWGFLARVFQHELDHLDGKLFIDRTKRLYRINERSEQ